MKPTKPIIEVIISSPPDRDVLVSELWVGAELLGRGLRGARNAGS